MMTLQQIADELGLTRRGVLYIIERALGKLKHNYTEQEVAKLLGVDRDRAATLYDYMEEAFYQDMLKEDYDDLRGFWNEKHARGEDL